MNYQPQVVLDESLNHQLVGGFNPIEKYDIIFIGQYGNGNLQQIPSRKLT